MTPEIRRAVENRREVMDPGSTSWVFAQAILQLDQQMTELLDLKEAQSLALVRLQSQMTEMQKHQHLVRSDEWLRSVFTAEPTTWTEAPPLAETPSELSSAATTGPVEKPLESSTETQGAPTVSLEGSRIVSRLTVRTGVSSKSILFTGAELEAVRSYFSTQQPTSGLRTNSGSNEAGSRGHVVPDWTAEDLAKVLKGALDRDWKDETPFQVAAIAANGLEWRDQEIELLRARLNSPLWPGPHDVPIGEYGEIKATAAAADTNIWQRIAHMTDNAPSTATAPDVVATEEGPGDKPDVCNMHLYTDQVQSGPRCVLAKGHAGFCSDTPTGRGYVWNHGLDVVAPPDIPESIGEAQSGPHTRRGWVAKDAEDFWMQLTDQEQVWAEEAVNAGWAEEDVVALEADSTASPQCEHQKRERLSNDQGWCPDCGALSGGRWTPWRFPASYRPASTGTP